MIPEFIFNDNNRNLNYQLQIKMDIEKLLFCPNEIFIADIINMLDHFKDDVISMNLKS